MYKLARVSETIKWSLAYNAVILLIGVLWSLITLENEVCNFLLALSDKEDFGLRSVYVTFYCIMFLYLHGPHWGLTIKPKLLKTKGNE